VDTRNNTLATSSGAVLVGADEEITYRSVSVLSIIALVVGLFAPLALLAPILWVIPALGLVLATIALSRINGSAGTLVGRAAALAGLALCVACIFAIAARTLVARQLVSQQARQVALEWIADVQAGATEQAFDRTLEATRPPLQSPLDQSEPVDPLARFGEHPVVRYLTTEGAGQRARFEGDLIIEFASAGVVHVQQQFSLLTAPSSAQEVGTIQVTLQRTRSSAVGSAHWLVSGYQLGELPTQSATTAP
jgi:hypothetical protein